MEGYPVTAKRVIGTRFNRCGLPSGEKHTGAYTAEEFLANQSGRDAELKLVMGFKRNLLVLIAEQAGSEPLLALLEQLRMEKGGNWGCVEEDRRLPRMADITRVLVSGGASFVKFLNRLLESKGLATLHLACIDRTKVVHLGIAEGQDREEVMKVAGVKEAVGIEGIKRQVPGCLLSFYDITLGASVGEVKGPATTEQWVSAGTAWKQEADETGSVCSRYSGKRK
jgi:hypothetical protein